MRNFNKDYKKYIDEVTNKNKIKFHSEEHIALFVENDNTDFYSAQTRTRQETTHAGYALAIQTRKA